MIWCAYKLGYLVHFFSSAIIYYCRKNEFELVGFVEVIVIFFAFVDAVKLGHMCFLLIDVHKFVGCTYCERKVLVEEKLASG